MGHGEFPQKLEKLMYFFFLGRKQTNGQIWVDTSRVRPKPCVAIIATLDSVGHAHVVCNILSTSNNSNLACFPAIEPAWNTITVDSVAKQANLSWIRVLYSIINESYFRIVLADMITQIHTYYFLWVSVHWSMEWYKLTKSWTNNLFWHSGNSPLQECR